VEDGTYIGICQNKILFAVVKVEVSGHEIRGIEILEHKKSYLPQAEMIAGDVLAGQSLEVDAISGATLTSDTVKKQSRMLCCRASNKRERRFNEDHFEVHSKQYQGQKDANRGYAAVHRPVHYLAICVLVHW